jgi:hypothetical protein
MGGLNGEFLDMMLFEIVNPCDLLASPLDIDFPGGTSDTKPLVLDPVLSLLCSFLLEFSFASSSSSELVSESVVSVFEVESEEELPFSFVWEESRIGFVMTWPCVLCAFVLILGDFDID